MADFWYLVKQGHNVVHCAKILLIEVVGVGMGGKINQTIFLRIWSVELVCFMENSIFIIKKNHIVIESF